MLPVKFVKHYFCSEGCDWSDDIPTTSLLPYHGELSVIPQETTDVEYMQSILYGITMAKPQMML